MLGCAGLGEGAWRGGLSTAWRLSCFCRSSWIRTLPHLLIYMESGCFGDATEELSSVETFWLQNL